jgi:pimeloyl-ACP methyl ester carboxylesterase
MGAMWTLSMAFARPERITRLIVVGSAVGNMTAEEVAAQDKRDDARLRADSAAVAAGEKGPEAIADETIQRIFVHPERVYAGYRDDLLWQMQQADPAQRAPMREHLRRLARERYDLIAVPTLIVWGEQDQVAPASRGRRMAATIPGARYVEIPDAGHTCQLEVPEQFVAIVASFLDETAASR